MSAQTPLTIVRLTAANLKRLKAVTITPEGNMVVLGGRNGQGKTSVLDAITYALGGKAEVCSQPVRRGEDSAEVVCDLGDLIVRRRFTAAGGTSLEVTSREGLRYSSPQAVLDALVGRLTFDPLAFSRMDPKAQRETLRALLGLDFAAQDARAAQAFQERTAANRDAKALAARLAALPEHPDAPSAPVAVGPLAAALQEAQQRNAANDQQRREARVHRDLLAEAKQELQEMRRRLALQENMVRAEEARQEALDAAVAALQDIDPQPLAEQLAQVDEINAKVRANQQRAEVAVALQEVQARSEGLSAEIDALAKAKAEALAAASMPIPGLGLGPDGVTLGELPLDQASAAEQLRVSVAIGLAMNPRLRVLLIRDASLLDSDSLRLVGEMAQAAGAQVWLERVEQDAATTVLIEDGQVAQEVAASQPQ